MRRQTKSDVCRCDKQLEIFRLRIEHSAVPTDTVFTQNVSNQIDHTIAQEQTVNTLVLYYTQLEYLQLENLNKSDEKSGFENGSFLSVG